ncbi:MAG: aminotransferase class V-fold PLP-dependent enzyme, partial [bacterium]|nr:aminotransferase class V-fold PLP-dependent enzyme [bacterium]
AVLDPARYLEEKGFKITYLPVDPDGLIRLDQLQEAITQKTILVSLMAANNEIGVLHPIQEVGKICKEKGILFHVDAAQGCGKIPINVQEMGIDLLSLSAHKTYGPKGVGALYVRNRSPRVQLSPLILGGRHEWGLRSGTLAVPGIVGMGKAFEIAGQELETETKRVRSLRDKLFKGLSQLEGITLNGHLTKRLSGNLNLSFAGPTGETGPTGGAGVSGEALMGQLKEIAVSAGSACSSESAKASHVLSAIGRSPEQIRSAIRFGIGRFTTEEEIDFVIEKVTEAVQHLREKQPR